MTSPLTTSTTCWASARDGAANAAMTQAVATMMRPYPRRIPRRFGVTFAPPSSVRRRPWLANLAARVGDVLGGVLFWRTLWRSLASDALLIDRLRDITQWGTQRRTPRIVRCSVEPRFAACALLLESRPADGAQA